MKKSSKRARFLIVGDKCFVLGNRLEPISKPKIPEERKQRIY